MEDGLRLGFFEDEETAVVLAGNGGAGNGAGAGAGVGNGGDFWAEGEAQGAWWPDAEQNWWLPPSLITFFA